MSTPAVSADCIGRAPGPAFAELLRAAARRVTWQAVIVTLAIAVALHAWLIAESYLAAFATALTAQSRVSGGILNLLVGFCVMFATLVADERVDRGARRVPAYAWAVVLGTAVAAIAQAPVHEWLQLGADGNNRPTGRIWQPIGVFLEYLLWAAICVAVYVSRRTALQAVARMSATQLATARARRRTFESRLQALQARIEPEFLATTLGQVRDLHASDPARGGRLLDELIVYLRAALPQLRESSSTVEQELRLASAYLNIRQPDTKHESQAAPARVLHARMPPMILLPVINHLLAARLPGTEATVRIAAIEREAALRIEIRGPTGCSVEADDALLKDVRERLRLLYADRATLTVVDIRGEACITLEICNDAADGDHR